MWKKWTGVILEGSLCCPYVTSVRMCCIGQSFVRSGLILGLPSVYIIQKTHTSQGEFFYLGFKYYSTNIFDFFWKYLCIVVLNLVTFILYSSFIIPLECCFSWHTSWKRCGVCLHMTLRFYEIYIRCIVVNDIDDILKLLTWARKCNILFHKNKTILL